MPPIVPAAAATASSQRARGTTSRVVIAQPWPACIDAVNAAIAQAPAKSASSSTRNADFPPSSRNTLLMVAAASVITARPVTVEPVNEIMSTSGCFDSMAPTPWSRDVTMLTTPAGKSVCSAISWPSTAAAHGVSGAGLRIRVLPAASAGPTLARLIWCGKFHGVIAPTTPTASRTMVRLVGIPCGVACPRSVVHW
ncbi:hypothetical protein MAUB1S_11930 [Mycolicibacterium aubagnense]